MFGCLRVPRSHVPAGNYAVAPPNHLPLGPLLHRPDSHSARPTTCPLNKQPVVPIVHSSGAHVVCFTPVPLLQCLPFPAVPFPHGLWCRRPNCSRFWRLSNLPARVRTGQAVRWLDGQRVPCTGRTCGCRYRCFGERRSTAPWIPFRLASVASLITVELGCLPSSQLFTLALALSGCGAVDLPPRGERWKLVARSIGISARCFGCVVG